MIVVVGGLAWRSGDPAGPAGRACEIAMAATSSGARVEVVGRAGDDQTGDALMLALTRARIGHVAVLRDPSHATPVLPPRPTVDSAEAAAADLALDDPDARPDAEAGARERPPGPPLEAADVSLGLQYLTAFGVLVVADDVPEAGVPVAVDAAGFAGARLVLLVAGDQDAGSTLALPPDATVLSVPADDDGSFGRLVGAYAAGLDAGIEPAQAFGAAVAAVGGEALEPSA
jgi:hypothetical protein